MAVADMKWDASTYAVRDMKWDASTYALCFRKYGSSYFSWRISLEILQITLLRNLV